MTNKIDTAAIGVGTDAPAMGLAVLGEGGYASPSLGSLVTVTTFVLNPPGVVPTFREITGGLGDNSTLKGVSGRFIAVGDDASVTHETKGCLYGLQISMQAKAARDNSPWDDVTALQIDSSGPFPSAVESAYWGHNLAYGGGVAGADWMSVLGGPVHALNILGFFGAYNVGLNFAADGQTRATFDRAVMLVNNNIPLIKVRNAADTADIEALRVGANDHIQVGQGAPVDIGGPVFLHNLPTADPHVVDQVWRSTNGVLMVSNG